MLSLSAIKANLQQGIPMREAIYSGCIDRLRPVMMTGCLAALGLPALFSLLAKLTAGTRRDLSKSSGRGTGPLDALE